MKYFLIKLLLLTCLILIPSIIYAEELPGIAADQLLGFAENLYAQGEYYRSVTEYQRFIFLYPGDQRVEKARFQIGAAYFAGEEWENAAKAWQAGLNTLISEKLRQQSLYKLAVCYYKMQQYVMCRNSLEQLRKEYPNSIMLLDGQKLETASFIEQDDWEGAAQALQQMDVPLKNDLVKAAEKGKDLPFKSPGLAGGLSAVLPGAGQVYAERPQDGAMAFFLNGLFIWGVVESFSHDKKVAGGILLFFESGWYLGNIYGAVNSAHKYNQDLKKSQRETVKENLNLQLSQFQDKTWGLSLCYRF